MIARSPLRTTAALHDDAFDAIRRKLVLDACKWDPQVGDVDTLARYALVIDSAAWGELSRTVEALAAELHEIEAELVTRPDLHATLGTPPALRRLFRQGSTQTPTAVRSLRFDFHWTGERFALSEVNSDVPGGYSEASSLSSLMLPHFESVASAGNPGARWADAITSRVAPGLPVALLVAPGFIEDVQIVSYFRRLLTERGVHTVIGHAGHMRANGSSADFKSSEYDGRVAAIVRFYQAEWLAQLDELDSLLGLFVGGATPVTNPGAAALTESKRLPLLWDRLRASTSAFRAAMPEAREVRDAPWLRAADEWVIKGAYSNTGDEIVFPDRLPLRARLALAIRVAAQPKRWVAQRRFQTAPIATPFGEARPCIGVYTIDGRVAGTYVRIATSEIVDGGAIDAACFVEAA